MQPITSMRNSLGKEYGGSGVPMDFEKYKQAVAFWEKHSVLKWFFVLLMQLHLFSQIFIDIT